jgi:hypothetical protein
MEINNSNDQLFYEQMMDIEEDHTILKSPLGINHIPKLARSGKNFGL